MRSLLFAMVFALSMGASQTVAICISGTIGVWPESGAIPVNARFIVDAHGSDVEPLRSVAACDFSLVADDHSVCLVPMEYSKGQAGVSQLVLIPQSELVAGKIYSLSIANDVLPSVKNWGRDRKAPEWFAVRGWDFQPPEWSEDPKTNSTFNNEFGCGTARGAQIEVKLADPEPYRLDTTVFDSAHQRIGQYLLSSDPEGLSWIGRGMCGGEFELAPGETYFVDLHPVDVAGNVGSTKIVTFTIPREP